MKGFRVFAVAAALMLFAVTAAFGMSTKSDYEKHFDFSQLRTFAFKTDRASNDPLSTNTLEAGRIQNALAAQLEANGFTQASQNPDFIVAFYSRTKQKTQVQSAGGFLLLEGSSPRVHTSVIRAQICYDSQQPRGELRFVAIFAQVLISAHECLLN